MSRIEREVLVNAPADSVYQVWRNFENFPNFMSEVDEVREEPRGTTHWRRKRTLGSDVEWDAEVAVDEPSHAIGWRAVGEGGDGAEALVEFESLGDATRVRYCIDHPNPSGVEAIASLFSNDERHVENDLRRFKEIVESSGYMRATKRIANVNTPEHEQRAVNERYPADTYAESDEATR
jgi:uncharacterized membrane protein